MGEFIANLRQQGGVERVLVARTLQRPRAAFRNWFSSDVDLFRRQARRASDVAP
jgi:hypothetical protein